MSGETLSALSVASDVLQASVASVALRCIKDWVQSLSTRILDYFAIV